MKLKELCELNNIPYNPKNPARSKAKLEQHYVLKQISKQQYEIVRPLTEEEMRSIKTYVRLKPIIKECICTALANVEGNTLQGSIKDYYNILAIVNNNYKYFTYSDFNELKKNYMISNNIPLENNILYYEFCKEVDSMFRRIIKECFKELENEMLIKVSTQLTFVTRNKLGYYISHPVTDPNVIQQFLACGKKYMLEYGYETWDEIPHSIKDDLREKISRDLNILYFYDRYNIVINKEFLPQKELKEVRSEINKLTAEKVSKSQQGVLKEWDTDFIQECINLLIKTT
jgi:hypothetical protein